MTSSFFGRLSARVSRGPHCSGDPPRTLLGSVPRRTVRWEIRVSSRPEASTVRHGGRREASQDGVLMASAEGAVLLRRLGTRLPTSTSCLKKLICLPTSRPRSRPPLHLLPQQPRIDCPARPVGGRLFGSDPRRRIEEDLLRTVFALSGSEEVGPETQQPPRKLHHFDVLTEHLRRLAVQLYHQPPVYLKGILLKGIGLKGRC